MPAAHRGESAREVRASAPRPMLIDDRFTAVAARFFTMFRRKSQGGGALSVYWHGEPVLDIWSGWADDDRRWQSDTISLSYSTSKGVAATVANRLIESGVLDLDTPVAEYWPEFAANGKGDITVRDVLRHRAGLQRVRELVPTVDDQLDHDTVAAALAAAAPDPMRLRASGYHAINFGTLVAEIAQRATGRDFPDILRTELLEPLGDNDFWFGVPRQQRHRIARLSPRLGVGRVPMDRLIAPFAPVPQLRSARSAVYDGWADLSIGPRAYDAMMPGWNGAFTARALGKMYGALANDGVAGHRRLFRPETTAAIAEMPLNSRYDYVLGAAPQFARGYHRAIVGTRLTRRAFGHFGIGGSGAMAIPGDALSVAFTTNRLGYPVMTLGDHRLPLLAALAQRAARTAAESPGAASEYEQAV
ncbi:serine hydrolase domain-containing protein [Nocardia huaxiensis]|nr:serine hydrolase domain-containing protein [Nocardia huaxiensis]